MTNDKTFLANEIKVRLIDSLVKTNRSPVLSNELLFSKNKRRADLVLLKNKRTISFEVKGDSDDTRRLISQIKDYVSAFDEVNIVCTPKLLKRIVNIVPKSVGIIIFDGKFKIIRKANINKVTKEALVFFMKKNELLKTFKVGNSDDTTDEVRKKVVKKIGLKNVKKAAFISLYKKLSPISKLFLKDRGCSTVNDDLLTLTGEVGPIR